VLLCPLGRACAQHPIRCNSDDGKKHYCQADTRRGVQIVKQRSKSPCTRGVSWDYDDRGIWVDKGCRADFSVESGDSGAEGRGCKAAVGAQKANQWVQQCLEVSPATHSPCNMQNACKLITDEIKRGCQMLAKDAPGFCEEFR
jgi:Protein of unknown function (DUF3011)